MQDFTKQDIDILIEAVEMWEKGDPSEGLMSGLLGAMLSDKMTQEDKDDWEAKEEKQAKERQMKLRDRKEQAILLKARLVQMKQSCFLNEANQIIQESK